MINCVNIKLKEFIDLQKETGIPTPILEIKVAKYQSENGLDSFPTRSDVIGNSIAQTRQYQKGYINDNLKETEFGIRDLAARLAARIGGGVRFESDLTKDYSGYNEGLDSVINLAKATLDTPIHEILGHPIIRAIKNKGLSNLTIEEQNDEYGLLTTNGNKGVVYTIWESGKGSKEVFDTKKEAEDYIQNIKDSNISYNNLLKELETGYGKEVLDRIKRDYKYKHYGEITKTSFGSVNGKDVFKYSIKDKEFFDIASATKYQQEEYALEEQQEEALVQLLGELTAGKLKETKENKNLISLLKQLLKEMTAYMRSLFNSKEIEIDKLSADMTLNDLANLLAYTNSKIILPGGRVEYTTPDNQKFSTYQEASNHISKLFSESKDVDLSDVKISKELSTEDLQKIKDLEKEKSELENYFSSKKYQQDKGFELYILNEQLEELRNKKVEFYSQEPFLDLEDKEKYGFQDFDYIRVESTYGRGNEYHKDILGENYEGYYIHGYNTSTGKPKKKILPITKKQAEEIWSKDESAKYEVGDRQEIYGLEDKIRLLNEDSEIKYKIKDFDYEVGNIKKGATTILGFIEKNKPFEQSKEIIETWKKENNIVYNPEEVYSRGQGFYSAIGAYSSLELDLLLQNLLQHIEDNKKAGGSFDISAFTAPVGKTLKHLGGESQVRFTIFPKSEDIKWAAPTDVYSGSVWDAAEKVSKDKKSELLGVSHTKYPSLQNINEVSPNLASIIDERSHHHNELGIELTTTNFRLEYDETVPYNIKKLVDSVNSILDERYGKIVKPEIREPKLSLKPSFNEVLGLYEGNEVVGTTAIQPTQTKENTTSIESVKSKIGVEFKEDYFSEYDKDGYRYVYLEEYNRYSKQKDGKVIDITKEEYESNKPKEKEYTSQALINTKISKLKEVAKAQPRSLITSKVINNQSGERQYQKKLDGRYEKMSKSGSKNLLGHSFPSGLTFEQSKKLEKAVRDKNEYLLGNKSNFVYEVRDLEWDKYRERLTWSLYKKYNEEVPRSYVKAFNSAVEDFNNEEEPSFQLRSKLLYKFGTNKSESSSDENDKLFPGVSSLSKTSQNSKLTVYSLAKSISKRTGIKFEFISESEMDLLDPGKSEGARGYYHNGVAYLVASRADETTAVHEIFGHPFLNMLKSDATLRPIYDSLLKQVNSIPGLRAEVEASYAKSSPQSIDDEVIMRALDMAVAGLINDKANPTLWSAIQGYFKAFTDTIKKIMGITSTRVNILSPRVSIKDLANWAVDGEGELNLMDGVAEKESMAEALSELIDNEKSFDDSFVGEDLLAFIENSNISRDAKDVLSNFVTEKGIRSLDELIGRASDILMNERSYQAAPSGKKMKWTRGDDMDKIILAKTNFINGLKSRVEQMKRDGVSTKSDIDKMNEMIDDINQSDETLASIKFIQYAHDEGLRLEKEMLSMEESMRNGEDFSAERLMSLYENFLKMFDSSLKEISVILLNADSAFEGYASKKALSEFKQSVASVNSLFTALDTRFAPLHEYKFRNKLEELANAVGTTTDESMFGPGGSFLITKDVTITSLFVGSPSISRVEQIRSLDRLMQNATNAAKLDLSNSGYIGKLTALAKEFNGGSPHLSFKKFYEQHNGSKTAFLISRLKYGLFVKNYDEFMEGIAKKYDLTNRYDAPSDPAEYAEYIKEVDAFLGKHTDRMFTSDYYELKYSLSPEANEMIEDFDTKIRNLKQKSVNEFGIVDLSLMSPADKNALFKLTKDKQALGNLRYTSNGEAKTGRDLSIAKEVSAYREQLSKKLAYRSDQEKFDAAKEKMMKDLTRPQFENWLKNNTVTKYKPKFWDDLSSIEKADQSPEWQALYDRKQAILSAFKDSSTMEYRVDIMDTKMIGNKSVKEWVDEANELLARYKNESVKTGGTRFSKIAEMVPGEAYKEQYQLYSSMLLGAPSESKIAHEWFENNHNSGDDGMGMTPNWYWMKIVPKDKSLIETNSPNSMWSVVDEGSEFYNKNYDPSLKQNGIQPKEDLYGNSEAFNRAISDPASKKFYETILEMQNEANILYSHDGRTANPLKMPQIAGGAMKRMFSEKGFFGIFKGILNELGHMFTVKPYEVEYGGDTAKMFKPDGSIIRNIPMFFKKMLDNTNSISDDMIHIYSMYYLMAANYKRKTAILPDVNVIMEGLARSKVSNRTVASKVASAVSRSTKSLFGQEANSVAAGGSNTYRRAKGMVDRSMYGIDSEKTSVGFSWKEHSIGGMKINEGGVIIDLAKPFKSLLSWMKDVNLVYNPLAITAGFATAELNLAIEGDIGVNLSRKSLIKASWEVMKMLPSALQSLSKRRYNNKVVALTRLFNVAGSEVEGAKGIHGVRAVEYVKEHALYGPYTAGDFMVKSRMLIAMLMEYRLHDGKFVNQSDFIIDFMENNPGGTRKDAVAFFKSLPDNLYDAFEVNKKTGQLSIIDDKKDAVSEKLMLSIMAASGRLAAKLDGILTASDRNTINTNAIASAIMMHRGWLVGAMGDRFGGKLYSYEKERMDEGQYLTNFASKTGLKMMANYLTFGVIKPLATQLENPETYQVYNTKRLLAEVKYMVAMTVLANIIRPDMPDEDKKDPSLQMWIWTSILRILYEQNAVFSPADVVSIITTITPALSQFQTMGKLVGGTLDSSLDEEVTSGKYKGKTHRFMYLSRLSPGWKNIYENFISPDLVAKQRYMKQNIGVVYNILNSEPEKIKKPKKGRAARHSNM